MNKERLCCCKHVKIVLFVLWYSGIVPFAMARRFSFQNLSLAEFKIGAPNLTDGEQKDR